MISYLVAAPRPRLIFAVWVCLGAAGCGDAATPGSETPLPGPELSDAAESEIPQRLFERSFLFASSAGATAVYVPWVFRSAVRPGGVTRNRSVWLGNAGSWELLMRETEETPTTRTPWRILPSRSFRVVAGQDESIEALVFRDAPRELATEIGAVLTEWSGPLGEAIRIHRGETELPSGRISGFVVDFSSNWDEPSGIAGDWLFLHAGDAAQFFLLEVPSGASRSPARYRGWSRVALRESQWPALTVEWSEVRGFEPARRDIPAGWSIRSTSGEVEGELEGIASHLSALPGEGPILPVSAVFEVRGTIRIEGESFTVTGLARHTQR